ncbi:MAG: OadG family protein [Bacteroidaceae bacterium]|nr:OadG family protein [Bacteroidaceae bacterium]
MSTFLAINWGNALIVTFFGFAVVFIVLILLIFVLQLFGNMIAAMEKKSHKPAETVSATVAQSEKEEGPLTAEESAAVAMAIYQYCFGIHDEESLVLTFHEQEEHYHPWNSKIIGINKFNKQ